MYMEFIFEQIDTVPEENPEDILNVLTYPLTEWLIQRCEYKHSYHGLINSEEYDLFDRLVLDRIDTKDAYNSVVVHQLVMFALINWQQCGKKTYTVTPKLAEALKETKLRKYPTNLLRSPNPDIYIEFPVGAFKLLSEADEITPSSTGFVTTAVEGAYILEDTSVEGVRLWRVLIIGQYTDEASSSVQVNHFYIPLVEDSTVDECLRFAIEMMEGKKELEVRLKGAKETSVIGGNTGRAWADGIIASSVEIFKFIMNVVIYITRSDADVTFVHVSPEYASYKERMLKAQGKKREDLKKRMRSLNSGTRMLLGKNYTIKRWDDKTASQHSESGRHITVRTLVSGHWRNQACGVGKLEHKTIWIEPFWRGPEAAPLTEKRAIVK
jgi:hypothetical protein